MQGGADFDKEELFAFAFLKHRGNGAAAAREVFDLKNNGTAYVKASRLLRSDKVCKIIDEFHETQRVHFKKFMEQGPYYLTVIAHKLIRVIEDEKTPFDNCMKACEMLARFAGRELSEAVTIARARVEAARPLPEEQIEVGGKDSHRKVLFMLSPPPMPLGMTPTPALRAQWESLGWRDGVVGP